MQGVRPSMAGTVTDTMGDLLAQDVDAIVNPWNRNLIPWWLLVPHGVSGQIRRRAGVRPFIELRRAGVLPPGGAHATSAGRLPHRAIVHVAGLTHLWTTNEALVARAARSALALASSMDLRSIALPLIGAGVGGLDERRALAILRDEGARARFSGEVRIVRRSVAPDLGA